MVNGRLLQVSERGLSCFEVIKRYLNAMTVYLSKGSGNLIGSAIKQEPFCDLHLEMHGWNFRQGKQAQNVFC